MATITAKAVTGNFSVGTNWVGDVAPTTGDTIIIPVGAAITVDAAVTVGDGVTLCQIRGTLEIAANMALTVGSPVQVFAAGTLTVMPGATLDMSGGAYNLTLGTQYSSTAAYFNLSGTASQKANLIGGSGIVTYGSIGCATCVVITHAVISGFTTQDNVFNGAKFGVDITNTLFKDTSAWTIGSVYCAAGDKFIFNNNDIRRITKDTNNRIFKIAKKNEEPYTADVSLSGNTFVGDSSDSVQIVHIAGATLHAGWALNDNILVDCFWQSITCKNNISRTIVYFSEDYGMKDQAQIRLGNGATSFLDGIIIGYNENSHGIYNDTSANNGPMSVERSLLDIYYIKGNTSNMVCLSGPQDHVVKNCLFLGEGQAILSALAANTTGALTVEHNTFACNSLGDPILSYEFAGFRTGDVAFKSNLVVDKYNNTNLPFTLVSGSNTAGELDEADYNTYLGPLASTLNKYKFIDNAASLGANDIHADPMFVDPTRSLGSYAASLNPLLSTPHDFVMEALKRNGYDVVGDPATYDPRFNALDARDYVFDGYAPTNAALKDAGHDGVTIGAMEYVSADDTAPVLTDPTATATGPTTATASVTTDDGNGTLYFLASTNATESAATVKAALSQSVTTDGEQSVSLSALDPETTYYVHFVQINGAGLESASAVTTNASTTPAIVYPEISATAAASSTSEVSATVTTDTAGGTIYGVLSESATVMTAAAIKSGADDTATVTTAGDYTLDEMGLSTWTQYYWHIVHEDSAGLMSNVLTIPVKTLDISIPLTFSDTAPATLLTVQVWSKVPKKADVEGLY